MPLTNSAVPVNFHISLNVADLDRSISFFRTLFGQEPAKQRSDYAKFESSNPPLTLSLEPMAPSGRGALNHLGFRFADSSELVELQRRLEMAGLPSQREEGVECCYARQTKFWLHDPDGNLWEFYVLEDNIEHRGAGQSQDVVLGTQPTQSYGKPTAPITCSASPGRQTDQAPVEKRTWAHRLGEAPAVPTPLADASLDEVALQGSLNGELDSFAAAAMLGDVYRVLSEGGRVAVHCLTADREVAGELQLPGPAAVVRNVPVDVELLTMLENQGFGGVRLTKFGASPCFYVNGVQMRETMIEAFKPWNRDGETVVVVYRGPFRHVTLDSGDVLRRGERTPVPLSVWRVLHEGVGKEQFVRLETPRSALACGG